MQLNRHSTPPDSSAVPARTSSQGAVLVEFLLGFVFFILLIYFYIDVSLSYVRYNMLVYATETVTRKLAVNFGTGFNYGTQGRADLEDMALTEMRSIINSFGFDGSTLQFTHIGGAPGEGLEIAKDCTTTPQRCFLVLNEVMWPSFSVATVKFPLFNMKTSTRSMIEDNCMNCVCP